MWQLMLNPSMGVVNRFLKAVGLGALAIDWLGKPSTAIWCVIASSQWQFVGYTAMLFVVAIQRIPDDFYEAAKIDGATSLQSFFYITLPNVKEMILLNLTTTLIGAFKVFDEVYIMTAGGRGGPRRLWERCFTGPDSGRTPWVTPRPSERRSS